MIRISNALENDLAGRNANSAGNQPVAGNVTKAVLPNYGKMQKLHRKTLRLRAQK
jgi:hypothetical protein